MIGVACIKEIAPIIFNDRRHNDVTWSTLSTGHSGVHSGDPETTAVVTVLPIEFELPLRQDLDNEMIAAFQPHTTYFVAVHRIA